jgi:type II secretory pathway component GspD/PulD (secretin)
MHGKGPVSFLPNLSLEQKVFKVMPGIYFLKTIVWDTMKLSLLQLCIAVVFTGVTFSHDRLSAQELLERRITLKMEDKSLKNVLSSIERTSEIKFIYNPNEIRSSAKVNFNASNEPLAEALNKLFRPLAIRYEVAGKQVMLFKEEKSSFSEDSAEPETMSRPNPLKRPYWLV